MVGALDVSSPRDARPLEVKDNAHSGLLAMVRGSPAPRAKRASRSSRVGGVDVRTTRRAGRPCTDLLVWAWPAHLTCCAVATPNSRRYLSPPKRCRPNGR
eukprot:5924304-Pleurochrysis_carterae.AAC.1